MTEQAGESATALDARLTALRTRHNALASADRALASLVADAHSITATVRKRLDGIEAEIEALVAQQDKLQLDTPAGARAAQRLLAAKLREIHDVVEQAVTDAAAKKALLDELVNQYGIEP